MKALRRSSTSTSPSNSSSPTAASSPPSSSWIHIRSLLVAAASSNSSSSAAAAAAAGTSVAALASASAAAPSSSSPASSSSPRSDRGGIKSPWSRRKRKRVLSRQQWDSQFSANGKLRDGGKKVLKKVRSGGIEPGIRAEVWPFLLGVYDLNSSEEERNTIKIKKSNYDIFHTRDRLAYAKIKPAVNQIETHPYFQRDSLVKFCQKHGIRVTAHTPLSGSTANTERYGGSASCLDDPIIKSLAEKYRARPPLGDPEEHGGHPKTSKAERLVENLSVFDFNISYEDMDKIKAIDRSHRTAQPTKFWGIDVFA